MASQGPRKLEEKLVCSICLEMFGTAVTMPCGHNFCMKCINNHWNKEEKEAPPGEKDYTCPDCRKRFEKRLELRKNVALCSVVELVRSGEVQASSAERKTPANGRRCSRHGRPLELYCQEDKMCICCVCTVQECRDHHRVLFEEERKRKEVLLEESLAKTQEETVKTEEEIHKLEEQTGTIKDSSERLKSGILQKFAHLMKELEECQRRAVDKIEQEQATALGQVEENWSQLQDHLTMLTQHRQKAQELLICVDDMKFLEEFLLLPSPASLGVLPAVEFNVASTVESTAKILTAVSRLLLEDLPNSLNPQAADAETKESTKPKALTVMKARPALPECELRVELLKDYRNLTFDPDTANKYLQLSNQNQKAKHTPSPDGLCQDRADRFELWQVLCSQSYSQDRHYWEVRISGHSVILGVTYKKIQRKKRAGRSFSIGLDGLSWGLQVREDCYLAWHEGQSHKIRAPLYKCLGVSLDYGTGVLSFYGIGDEMKLLHSFHCVFTEPLYPVFWLCEGRAVTLCQQN
ncbi:tripartite motif-containing protein 65 [Trachemys scripta elegans]|uniref:tripartite motif-containing protein 65 n=1 Tax=Trachemys scripta elegans TaxID=31138 RepID=UPI001551CD0E|nr:tripartite motif-containing protein 65 [Trachemys scripta elegans]